MYLAGGPHPHRDLSQQRLAALIAAGEPLVTDAEVLQEIVHRYNAIGRRDRIHALLQQTLRLVTTVFPITQIHVLRAAEIIEAGYSLSARDAIHIAVMENHGVRRIFSFDASFDRWPSIERFAQLGST